MRLSTHCTISDCWARQVAFTCQQEMMRLHPKPTTADVRDTPAALRGVGVVRSPRSVRVKVEEVAVQGILAPRHLDDGVGR